MWNELCYICSSIVFIRGISSLSDKYNTPVRKGLWDIIHSNTDGVWWSSYVNIVDYLLVIIMGFGIIHNFTLFGYFKCIEIMLALTHLQWLRCIIVFATQLPTPVISKRTIISSYHNDLSVSGHAMTAAICLMHLNGIWFIVCFCLSIIMCLLSILSREHYTSDILIGLSFGILPYI